jgi:predicted nucleic acid-binding protein
MESKYIMDANVFITAHRQRYPFDVAPSFWEQLVDKAADKILIIEEVQNEILKGKDLLADWYSSQSPNFTVLRIPEQEVIGAYRKIINFVNDNKRYTQSAKDEFASIADSWLCAYALAYGSTIVTLETYQAGVKNRVKIPNVCKEFGIRYIDLLQFMREVGIRL